MFSKIKKIKQPLLIKSLFYLYFFAALFISHSHSAQPTLDLNYCVDASIVNRDSFTNPTNLIWHPTANTWIVSEKTGEIYTLSPRTGWKSLLTSLDDELIAQDHGGLLSTAFYPNYAKSPLLFVTRTIVREFGMLLVLEHYKMKGLSPDKNSRKELLRIVMPKNQNISGNIIFDNDGFLLMSIGDGGSQSDAANPHTLLGTLLRLDVDTEKSSLAANNNPFLDLLDGAPEVFAYAFRDPTSLSIDPFSKNIWLTDSSPHLAGEINQVKGKYFYGWDCQVGDQQNNNNSPICTDELRLEGKPEFSYTDRTGYRIVGGIVYRGKKILHYSEDISLLTLSLVRFGIQNYLVV